MFKISEGIRTTVQSNWFIFKDSELTSVYYLVSHIKYGLSILTPKKCIAYSNWLLLKWAIQHLSWRWTSNYLSVSEAEGLWQSKRTISNTFWIFVLEKYFSILILKSGCIINISWPFLHRLVFQSMFDIVSNSLHVHDVCLFKK